MNNKTHTYRDKGRALFLAAIMVLSMVAMAATFAGPAVADVDAASPGSPEDVTVGQGAVAQDISDINITGASTDDTINVSLDSVVDEGVDISGNTADYSTTNTTGEAAVEAVNTTSNTVSVNVTAVDGGDVSFTLGISNLDTTGANFASGLTYDVTHVGNNTVATDEFDLVGFEVTDLDAPRVTQNDTEITVSATITSHFNENVTQTIQYNATDGDNQGGPVDNEVANESIDLTPGEERNVEFTVNTANISNGGDLPNGGALPREYTHGIFSENDDEQARLTVGVEDDGSIAVTVRGDFDPAVGDVTDVALFTADEWDPDPADRGDPFRVLSTDESGEPNEVEFRNLAIGPDPDNGVEYTALAAYNDSAFESSFETDSLNAQTKTSTGFDIFIDRVVTADQITIEDYDPADSVEVGESIDITTLVQSYEVDDSDLNSLDPFADTTVTVTDIEQTAGEAGTPLQNINEGQSETTDQDGLAVFEDVSVNLTPDDVDDDLVYDITFEATESDDDETVDVTGTVTFEAEPPSGDGVIQGNVEEINEDIELGAQNAEAAEGVNVHAVTLDRLQENTINGTDSEFIEAALDGATQSPTLWVNNTDQAFFRTVVENETSGEIVEVLNVETDYLFKGDVAVSQNLSIEGTGFNAEATNGDGAVSVSVLEPDEELEDDYRYAVQRSADGNFTGAVTVEFNAPNDLTYDGTADRYSDVPAYPTDVTNDDGSYNLQGLYTDNEAGLDYVVIAGDGNADLGFANGQGYDVVNVQQSADSDDPQLNTPLNVQQVDVTADAVDIENVGTIPSADYADEDYESVLDEFDDTADEVRQEIPRDNSTVDVINLGTFVEEDGTLVGANVTVSYDADGDFNGAFLDAAVNGDVVAHDDGEITVNTEDGESP